MLNIDKVKNTLPKEYSIEFTGQLAETTKRCYLADICEFFNVDDINEISIDQIKTVNVSIANQYVAYLVGKGLKPSTVNRKLQSLSKFYSFLSQNRIGIMEYDPFSVKEGCRRIRFDKTHSNTRCLTKNEIGRIIETIKRDSTITGVRNSIIILLLYSCGMRRGEVGKLKVGDIHFTDDQYVIKYIGKKGSDRMVQISDTIKILIDKYLEMRGVTYEDKEEPLFISHSSNKIIKNGISGQAVFNIVKKIAKEAGLKDVDSISPHSLRHSFVTESIKKWGVGVAQKLAGHADISTTRIYDHTNDVLERKASTSLLADFGL